MSSITAPELSIRAMHLDLKGLPPLPERLLALPRVAALGGYNSILVEWEDAFPWTCDERFRSPTAYSPQTILDFAKEAASAGVQIIPLVQCLGHMETPLRYRLDLREIPDRPEVLNVTAKGAGELVLGMIEDVLALLPDVTHFHLGGDEARSFGTHPQTAKAIESLGKDRLYLQHVEPLLDALCVRNIRPILWHDMMRSWSDDALKRLASKADLCAWFYHGDPTESSLTGLSVLQRFHDAGIHLWLGTAFKGADGADADLPDASRRLVNVRAWMTVAQKVPFVGAVATGWSRHATPGMQNEPLDAALDVMLAVGRLLRDGREPTLSECVSMLHDTGEGERFTACREVMFNIADSRRAAWHMVVQAHQQLALEASCPTRVGSRIVETVMGYLNDYITDLQRHGQTMTVVFEPLVARCWIDEYMHVRVDALLAAQRALKQLMGSKR